MHDYSQHRDLQTIGIAIGITFTFFLVELFGGVITNSLALLTDAWHMLNDVCALILSIVAAWVARRPMTPKRTFGYYRAEILAAFLQGLFLWVIVIFVFYEAIHRIQQPPEVMSFHMLVIAICGLIANGLSAATLSRSKDESLNIKGAFLHVIADLLGSVGAICAGVIMLVTGWYPVDTLVSMMIGILIFYSAGKLLFESVNILLEGAPSHIDVQAVERRILEVDGVKNVHDLHVWCITPTKMCTMSGHVVVEEDIDKKEMMRILINLLKEEFGIVHTTIQMEDAGYPKAAEEH